MQHGRKQRGCSNQPMHYSAVISSQAASIAWWRVIWCWVWNLLTYGGKNTFSILECMRNQSLTRGPWWKFTSSHTMTNCGQWGPPEALIRNKIWIEMIQGNQDLRSIIWSRVRRWVATPFSVMAANILTPCWPGISTLANDLSTTSLSFGQIKHSFVHKYQGVGVSASL